MGVSNYLDIFQDKMNEMFHEFDFIRAYINDLLIITKGDRSDHLEILELTPQKIKDNELKCNIKKSLFGKTEMKCLGFWVIQTRIQPINNK